VLTQFQSHTLNSHIAACYPPMKFGPPDQQAWVDVLAAQQTVTEREWYQGSADAVRKNIGELKDEARGITPARDYVILSGSGGATAALSPNYVCSCVLAGMVVWHPLLWFAGQHRLDPAMSYLSARLLHSLFLTLLGSLLFCPFLQPCTTWTSRSWWPSTAKRTRM
jgi:hypothetical protein